MPNSKRLLLASIHDVGPRFEDEVDRLADRLARLLGGPHFAMLVVPNHWDEAPLSQAPGYQRKLRDWSDAGVEIFLHGWRHRDDGVHAHGVDRFRARHMTAGEGEFLGLEREEALRRMRAGRTIVENAIGRPVAGFIAPAWLYGEGARAALLEEDFALAEDHMRVWRPSDGRILARGPVITWASRSKSRIASSLAFARMASASLGALPTVRIAVHPGDTSVPSLLKSIDQTVIRVARNRTVGRYGDLLD